MNLEKLYDQAKQGDKAAEERLFHLLTVRLRLFAIRMVRNQEEAHDVVQEAMVTIVNGFRDKGFEKGFLPWSYTVLKHAVSNRLRKQRRRRELDQMMSAGSEPQFQADPDLKLRLRECLRELVLRYPMYARVLNLKHQGYKTERLCRMLDISRENLYVLHHRARAVFKACVNRGDQPS